MQIVRAADQQTNEQIRMWVQNELGHPIDGDCRCMGVIIDDKLVAGIVYHGHKGFMVECSLASTDPRWIKKSVVKAFMSYPFEDLDCVRFWATCRKGNKKMRALFERLGFKYEGCARKAYDGVEDAMIYSILRDENKWLN